MQSYKQYWQSLPVDHTFKSKSSSRNRSGKKIKRDTGPINPGDLPFDSSRLPVIARKRIRAPITPPPTPKGQRTLTEPRQSGPPTGNLTLLPSPSPASFDIPQTPSLRSDNSSTPSGSTLLTPITPPHLSKNPPLEAIPPEPDAACHSSGPTNYVQDDFGDRCSRDDTPTPAAFVAVAVPEQPTYFLDTQPPVQLQIPIILHHVSSSGGPVAALRRYNQVLESDSALAGMSLFLNCPKRRVPFCSETQLVRYRKVAEAWKKSRKSEIGGGLGMRTIVHAVHTSNLRSLDSNVRFRSFLSLMSEMRYAQMLGIDVLVFQRVPTSLSGKERGLTNSPGSTGQEERAKVSNLDALAEDLVLLLEQVPDVTLAMENSTHRCRGQLGRSISELEYLIKRVGPRLKVCLDLCHLHVDQYDLSTSSGRHLLSSDLDRLGCGKIAAVHVSDSMEIHGGSRDLHAGLGRGTIGLDGLREILRHPQLLGKVPYLLETPPSPSSSGHHRNTDIQRLAEERSRIERQTLQDMLGMTEEEWNSPIDRDIWWARCQGRIKAVDGRISRLVGKIESDKDLHLGWTPAIDEIKKARRRKTLCTQSFSTRARSGQASTGALLSVGHPSVEVIDNEH